MYSFKPYLAAVGIVLIWAGWITISRFAVNQELQPADITLLRYCTACICILPLIIKHNYQSYKLYQYLIIGLGVGFPYTLFSFQGLQEVKAARAGVLVNGMHPVMGAVSAFFIFRQKISSTRIMAVLIIFTANYIMAGSGLVDWDRISGILLLLLLLGVAAVYTMHLVGVRKWNVTWQEPQVTVAIVNTVLFIPLWFFLPSGFSTACIG